MGEAPQTSDPGHLEGSGENGIFTGYQVFTQDKSYENLAEFSHFN